MRHAPPRSVDVFDVRKRSVNDKCSLPTIIPQSAYVFRMIKARRAFKTGEWVAIFWMGFALRCFQRLSITAWLPGGALSDNRYTT